MKHPMSSRQKELLLKLTLDETRAQLQKFDARFHQQGKSMVYTFTARHPILRWIQFTGTAQAVDGRYTLIRYGGTSLPLAFSTMGLIYLALMIGVFMVFRGGIGELFTVLTITGGIIAVSVMLQMIQSLAGDSLKRLFHDQIMQPINSVN
jgi:hypothetical protein